VTRTTEDEFDALVVVSPACEGQDTKDQDRARWSAPMRVAAVCDGVTSSPYSAAAAKLAAEMSPMLFGGNTEERMRALSELLIARRLEAQRARVDPPSSTPEPMRRMLQEVAQEQLRAAFQTTLVAACMTPADEAISVEVLRCGDSAFFAFSQAGELLASSLAWAPKADRETHTDRIYADPEPVRFGPGDELLVRIIGTASDRPLFAELARISPTNTDKWLVCVPLHRRHNAVAREERNGETPILSLGRGDLVLVPYYLVKSIADLKDSEYRQVRYSAVIRPISSSGTPSPKVGFEDKGSVTAVLPDHFYSRRWVHLQDRFPSKAHFVLASDGFYGSFDDPGGLWEWLQANEADLRNSRRQDKVLHDLHKRLNTRKGDDDISFVWVCPHKQPECRSVEAGSDSASEGKGHAC